MTLEMQNNKLAAVMVMAALTAAAFVVTNPAAAFAQSAVPEVPSLGGAIAGQALNEILFGNMDAQTLATPETNNLDESDTTTVTRTNAPVQIQEGQVAVSGEAEGLTPTELLGLLEGLLGGGIMQ
jgi:SpoU rRNA methylase family enzyme